MLEKPQDQLSKPLNLICVFGPDKGLSTSTSPLLIKQAWDETSLNHDTTGDTSNGATLEGITKTLSRSSGNTHIHYLGHGGINKSNIHCIDIISEPTTTQGLLAKDKDKPGIRHIWSCYCGAAKDAVIGLGEGNPIILHSGKKYNILNSICVEGITSHGKFYQDVLTNDAFYSNLKENEKRPPDAFDAFEFSMLTSPETVTLSILINGEVKSFKASAPKGFISEAELKFYQERQLQELRQWRKDTLGHKEETFLNMTPVMTTANRNRYLECGALLEAGRKNSKHAEKYVSEYLASGINPNCTYTSGVTLFDVAEEAKNIEVMKLLLIRSEELNQTTREIPPLSIACRYGWTDVVDTLVQKGASVNQPDKNGKTPLSIACEQGNNQIADILIKNGADINQKDTNLVGNPDRSPLYTACENGHLEIVKLLLADENTNVNLVNCAKNTPLFAACEKGNL